MAKKQILLNIDEELVDKLDAYRYANKMTRTAAIIKCIQDGIPDAGRKVFTVTVGEEVDLKQMVDLVSSMEPSETPDAPHVINPNVKDGW